MKCVSRQKSLPMLSAMLVMTCLVLTASLTLSQTTSEEAGVDPLGFSESPVDSVGVLLDINSNLRWQLDYAHAQVAEARSLLAITNESWYSVAWKSEPMRWIIFLVGVLTGAYASK